ncbi:MAG TPA: Clp protease N-terminal domain-containing protein [Solirubrobacteraceae bacterium]|nr:Clp protease N-terminal domain-containing protein [Solirubrobacteraceae bacterium]
MREAFSQQAQNLILLAADEARMLGRSRVEPEHLLLAIARRGNVKRLLGECDVRARDVHAAIVAAGGRGDDLVLGYVPWSEPAAAVLSAAVSAAALRGQVAPGTEDLLLALDQHDGAAALLRATGVSDVAGLVERAYPRHGPPVSIEAVSQYLLRVEGSGPPRPGPIPPVFERYSDEARRALRAAAEAGGLLQHAEIQPFHLLLGCVHVPDSLAARMLEPILGAGELTTIVEAMERARQYGPNPDDQATGIYSETARRIVAEDALVHAYRRGHETITTGHLALAVLDCRDRTARAIVGAGAQGEHLARSIERALPGDEHATSEPDLRWLNFDHLLRTLGMWFQQIVPQGWTVLAAGRRSGIWARPPDARSEADYRVLVDWIVERGEPTHDRLLTLTRQALGDLQAVVAGHLGAPWPSGSANGHELPPAHAEVVGDEVNPLLRLFYGDPDAPVLEMPQPALINMLIDGWG